jgi:dTDP-4-dehydrorhamnose 3,5-epimerase
MVIKETALRGCFITELVTKHDGRGGFMRSFDREAFTKAGLPSAVDHTAEVVNPYAFTLRGMHYQSHPEPEAKLVRCIKCSVFDVAVDLRPQSATYGQWFGLMLNADDGKALFIGEGFAHGYLTLSENTTLSYHLFTPYRAELQRGFRYDDPRIAIKWPAKPALIGERDLALPEFAPGAP